MNQLNDRTASLAKALAAAAALMFLAGPVAAEEEKPTEMPYATPGKIPQLSPDYRQTSHKVVLITDDAISPRSVNLKEYQRKDHPAEHVTEVVSHIRHHQLGHRRARFAAGFSLLFFFHVDQ